MIQIGNYKSSHSEMNTYALEKAIIKKVGHGWALPLTISSLQSVNNAGVFPLGVAEQFSINENVERYIKQRVTHNCSFPGISGLFVNNFVQRELLQPRFYVFCLFSILHIISSMQNKWPTKCIFMGETDLYISYRLIHSNDKTVSTCIAIVENYIFYD